MRWSWALLGGLLGVGFAGGCSAYVSGYDYVPRPALAQVAPVPPQKEPPVTAVVALIGIRRADPQTGIPLSVQVRMRLDNNGAQPVSFDAASLQLSDSTLLVFAPPLVRPPQSAVVPPMQSWTMEAYFPFPPGHCYDDMDLSSLTLRWQIKLGNQPTNQGVTFQRIVYYDYGPYWGYPPYWW